jgi:hypothetical protein
MNRHRPIGLEQRDGDDVGRDPRAMSADELTQLGHCRVSPLRALRLKCLDCCNESAQEVRLCTAVGCPSWPFRLTKNPWLSPLSAEARAQKADLMRRNRVSALTTPDKNQVQIDASDFDRLGVPKDTAVDLPSSKLGVAEGGAS